MKFSISYAIGGLVLALGVITGVTFMHSGTLPHIEEKVFQKRVQNCSKETAEKRFSCFRAAIENYHFFDGNPQKTIASIKSTELLLEDAESYAVFGTSCHTFYHALGDYMGTYAPEGVPVRELLAECPDSCTGGCLMGLYKRIALEGAYEEAILRDLAGACEGEKTSVCSHELGHVLHDKHVGSILSLLDDISRNEYGLTVREDYAYTSGEAPDLNKPFEDCRYFLSSEEDIIQCYTGVGHNLFLFSEFSTDGYTSQFEECKELDSENRTTCYQFLSYRIGINDAAPKYLEGKFSEGEAVCEMLEEYADGADVVKHCFRGIGGGIGLFIDSEVRDEDVTEGNKEALANFMFSKVHLCKEAPPTLSSQCYQGVLGTKFREFYEEWELDDAVVDAVLLYHGGIIDIVG